MLDSDAKDYDARARHTPPFSHRLGRWLAIIATVYAIGPASKAFGADASDPVLDLLLQKGIITEDEAARVKAQADAIRTNSSSAPFESKWRTANESGIKSLELFGDIRVRREGRSATDPNSQNLDLERFRYSIRLGLRGEISDGFYYGLRFEPSSNPRSSWVTFGQSSGGPFGKSTAGINLGQAYLGWRPEDWVDVTVGKMPNPIYTTPMVWDPDLNPEGAAERFKYTVGDADLFATFGQFIYEDTNPSQSAPGYVNVLNVNSTDLPFILAWQLGINYHLTKTISFKVAPVLYSYNHFNNGHTPSGILPNSFSPDYAGTYVGQGTTFGLNGVQGGSFNANGPFDGFWSNQDGINNLQVLEIPFELNLKTEKFDLRLFGDYAQNLLGTQRAQAAYNVSQSSYFTIGNPGYGLYQIPSVQPHDNVAYQIGFAIGSKDSLGLVNGTTSRKHSWEFRTYWQHIEQYALDPNLIDSDIFEGRENMQGIYMALAYGFTDNFIGTFRYGRASRINDQLGTGGSNQDIPQMNPIEHYHVLQLDLTYKF